MDFENHNKKQKMRQHIKRAHTKLHVPFENTLGELLKDFLGELSLTALLEDSL